MSPGLLRVTPRRLLRGVDLAATSLFALEGGIVAAEAGADVFGVLVLAFATALGGGITRDVLIGNVPPNALRSVLYATAAFAGGGVVVVAYELVDDIPAWLITGLDAGGLGLFCVTGAAVALDHALNPLMAVLLGTITAVGGGVLRDVLLDEVPAVLETDIYAVAAMLGAAVMVAAVRTGAARAPAMALGTLACFGLRVLAAGQDWSLPRVRGG